MKYFYGKLVDGRIQNPKVSTLDPDAQIFENCTGLDFLHMTGNLMYLRVDENRRVYLIGERNTDGRVIIKRTSGGLLLEYQERYSEEDMNLPYFIPKDLDHVSYNTGLVYEENGYIYIKKEMGVLDYDSRIIIVA